MFSKDYAVQRFSNTSFYTCSSARFLTNACRWESGGQLGLRLAECNGQPGSGSYQRWTWKYRKQLCWSSIVHSGRYVVTPSPTVAFGRTLSDSMGEYDQLWGFRTTNVKVRTAQHRSRSSRTERPNAGRNYGDFTWFKNEWNYTDILTASAYSRPRGVTWLSIRSQLASPRKALLGGLYMPLF